MKQIEKIEKMEKILDEHSENIEKLEKILDKFDAYQEKYNELKEYYIDGDYRKDYEDYEQGKIDRSVKCGVLSEDAVFNLMGDNYHLAIKMLEIATKIIKNH